MPLSCIPVESGVTSDTSLRCVAFAEMCFGLRSPKNNYRATEHLPCFRNRQTTSSQACSEDKAEEDVGVLTANVLVLVVHVHIRGRWGLH